MADLIIKKYLSLEKGKNKKFFEAEIGEFFKEFWA